MLQSKRDIIMKHIFHVHTYRCKHGSDESDEGKEILKQLGIEGEWEGIGHCAVGYMDCELPPPPARKDGRVVWA